MPGVTLRGRSEGIGEGWVEEGFLPWRTLLVLVSLSGMSSLIYQVVWFRIQAFAFGVSSYALGTVLAAFMGGLAIGSLVGGWLAERSQFPLRAYAWMEIITGLWGFLVLPLFDGVQTLYVSLAPAMTHSLTSLTILRFVLSLCVFLPSTSCMGTVLPLLIRGVVPRLGFTRSVSQLYAGNTAGAAMGLLLSGFLLIGLFGFRVSSWIAVAGNLGVGIYLLAVAGRRHSMDWPIQVIVTQGEVGDHSPPPWPVRRACPEFS